MDTKWVYSLTALVIAVIALFTVVHVTDPSRGSPPNELQERHCSEDYIQFLMDLDDISRELATFGYDCD